MLSRSLVAVAAVVIVGALVPLSAGARENKVPTVKMVLKEWTLTPSSTAVAAGQVSFVVRNIGGIPHEFVVLRTKRHHHALPMKAGQAAETGAVGEIEEIKPGQTQRLTLRLTAGKYVLLCNLPGHYKAGQYAALLVR